MVNLLGFNELPADISAQIGSVVDVWKKHLGDQLVGVYLHGSIALGAFSPDSGDIDILIVVNCSLSPEMRLDIVSDIILLDKKPRPLEMSAVRLCDLENWKNPGNCVFHYSDFWTERCKNRLNDPGAKCYIIDNDFPDADVTSYIRLIWQCGIPLYGRAVNEIFPDIPDDEFWAAISADVADYDFHSYAPRYLASNILILGRILSFRYTKRILSKYDGGLWMIGHLPDDLKYLPELAMKVWFGGETHEFPEDDLERLREYLVKEITAPGF